MSKLSYVMKATLRAIGEGGVEYDGLFSILNGKSPGGRVTLEALELRGLVRIDYDHPLPDPHGTRFAYQRRWPVLLTDEGREQLEAWNAARRPGQEEA